MLRFGCVVSYAITDNGTRFKCVYSSSRTDDLERLLPNHGQTLAISGKALIEPAE
jgi:hypothetical protein